MRYKKVERRSAIMTCGNGNKKVKVGLVAIWENGYTPNNYFFDYDEGEEIAINRNNGDGFDPLGYGEKPWFMLPEGMVKMVITFNDEVDEVDDEFEVLYKKYLDTKFNPEDRAEAKFLCDRVIKLNGKKNFAKDKFKDLK